MFPLYVRNDNANSILGVFRPIYVVARIFGLFPFSVNLEKSSFVRNNALLSKTDLLLFAFHMALYSSYAYLNVCTNTNKYITMAPVLSTGTRLVLVGGIFACIGIVIGELLNRKNVWKIFRRLELCDREVIGINQSSW